MSVYYKKIKWHLNSTEKCILKRPKCHGCNFVQSEFLPLFFFFLEMLSFIQQPPSFWDGRFGFTSAASPHLALDVGCPSGRKRQETTEVSECLKGLES